MSKIFISYKQKDKDTVLPIVKAIKQETGMDCWIDQHISLKDAAVEVLETAGVSTVASYMLNPIVGAGIVGYKLWSKLSSGGKQSEEEMLDSIIAGLNAQYGIHIHRQDAGSPGHTVVLEC